MVTKKAFFVYILTNQSNSVLYIGVTNNLQRRVYQHKHKLIDGFTSKYNLSKLVYYETVEMATSAILREKSLKNLVRRKKVALVNKFNPNWKDLDDVICK